MELLGKCLIASGYLPMMYLQVILDPKQGKMKVIVVVELLTKRLLINQNERKHRVSDVKYLKEQ